MILSTIRLKDLKTNDVFKTQLRDYSVKLEYDRKIKKYKCVYLDGSGSYYLTGFVRVYRVTKRKPRKTIKTFF